jgi:hypothetical protein
VVPAALMVLKLATYMQLYQALIKAPLKSRRVAHENRCAKVRSPKTANVISPIVVHFSRAGGRNVHRRKD